MRLSQEISRVRRVRSPLSIVVAGIDNLESLLEKHGQGFKDAVLVKVGSLIKRIIRFNDLPCRYEGDKFSIILPDTTIDGAMTAAEKVLENIRSMTIKHQETEEKVQVTLALVQFKINMTIGQFIETGENCCSPPRKRAVTVSSLTARTKPVANRPSLTGEGAVFISAQKQLRFRIKIRVLVCFARDWRSALPLSVGGFMMGSRRPPEPADCKPTMSSMP